ncbi:2-oxoisovalerate dehydrogenase E2 component (dihydrolipoyl transacylase) [Afipia massiliensis]|uniref:Dihydrolipoamide acetyltransferase component of pyruvate dehydrogenase complex n=1 Tax=Afipia massiliensis TaxID=211460 RepID=A0A840N8A2_9BRAD|nr:dihydrolipoamide acetyltransferase family protein [Afipia massiliensis]MBB5054038.1 2-oxoisovalerate dehydrogenase E2 component (dihydrolipoyl transacylase) [Afipia massiliensis]
MENYTFRLPDVGEGVAEAEIVAWHVKIGDLIDEDQLMVDVMTDKATVEMTTPVAGRVIALHGEIGQRMPVGSVLIELDTNQNGLAPETAKAPPKEAPASKSVVAAPVAAAPVKSTSPAAPAKSEPARFAATRAPGDLPLAAPATRRRAYELGLPLQFVPGTGPGGRITAEDLNAYVAGTPAGASVQHHHAKREGITETRIVGLRRKIAENMQVSKRRIPHFTYVEEFDLTELGRLRREVNAEGRMDRPKLTLLPFFMRALVSLVADFPQVNARYDDETSILRTYEGLHIGIATQTPGGLMVPVVHHVEALGLFECASELARVTKAAREGKATRDELTGSTITLTSLGALGGVSATPVINYPEVAIIGPNKLVERPVVLNGQVAVRTMMNLSASFDHRIVDGYDAARFIQALKRLIEQPALLFMDRA